MHRQLNRQDLKRLQQAGFLSVDGYWSALGKLTDTKGWLGWLKRACLAGGMVFLSASVVLFIAFNWQLFEPWQKLAVLQLALLSVLMLGQWLGFQQLLGQWLLWVASVLVGVNFALYGQVYQTGADAFDFFSLWLLCITPWVLVGQFAQLWVLWLWLANLSLGFFWQQVAQPLFEVNVAVLVLVMTLLNGTALFLSERLQERQGWLSQNWLLAVLLLLLLMPLAVSPFYWYDWVSSPSAWSSWFLVVIFTLVVVATSYYFFARRFNVLALGLIALAVNIYVFAIFLYLFDGHWWRADFFTSMCLMSLIMAASLSASGQCLRYCIRHHAVKVTTL